MGRSLRGLADRAWMVWRGADGQIRARRRLVHKPVNEVRGLGFTATEGRARLGRDEPGPGGRVGWDPATWVTNAVMLGLIIGFAERSITLSKLESKVTMEEEKRQRAQQDASKNTNPTSGWFYWWPTWT